MQHQECRCGIQWLLTAGCLTGWGKELAMSSKRGWFFPWNSKTLNGKKEDF